MKKKKTDPVLIFIYICIGIGILYFIAQLGYAFDVTPKNENNQFDLPTIANTFEANMANPNLIKDNLLKFDTNTYTVKFTVYGVIGLLLWLLYKYSSKRNYRKGEEHGSARWATLSETKKLLDKDPKKNIILTNEVKMSLNSRKTRKNLNITIVGGSGAGKTRFFVKPNLMQMNTSYVITDPKGELLRSSGKMLEDNGYKVKVFNLINMRNSFNYNPFAYLQDADGNYNDTNVIKLINVLMQNTKKEGNSGGDQFWDDATEALLLALTFFLVYEGEEHEKNFATVMNLLQLAEAKEDEEDFKSPLDFIFEDLEKENPMHPAIKYYKIYKKAAGKTAKSILISTAVRLKAFNNTDVMNLTCKDSIDIPSIGEKKTALFVVIPDSDDTFNFLVAMLYTQIFDVLYGLADFKHGGRLPMHVRFLLDEFANIGRIPKFDKLIATMRSREISVNVIIQNMAQLKTMYKNSWESIIGNCDSLLFLGGKEQTSLDYMSKALGKQTIDTLNRNRSKSYRNSSTSHNEGIVGRELMTPDEIGAMPDSDCILLIRGLRPFYSNKFKIEKHKNYSLLEDSNKNNAYDISNLKTEEMSIGQTDETEFDVTDDENEKIIKEILNDEKEGDDDEEMTSNIEIPMDEEIKEGLSESAITEEPNEGGDELEDITIEDLKIDDDDILSDLNLDTDFLDEEYITDGES